MNAALAAWYGVPVVAVTGDDVAVSQLKEDVPGIKTVAVKHAINTRASELKPLQQARNDAGGLPVDSRAVPLHQP